MGNRANLKRLGIAICAIGTLAACGEEAPPPSVDEFMADSVLLDATMLRCVENRDRVNYDPECVNAREAVERLAAAKAKERQDELEAQSARKREALRRAQEAVDAANRRAMEAERLRQEAEYLGLVDTAPDDAARTPVAAVPQELSFITVDDRQAAHVTVQDVGTPAGDSAASDATDTTASAPPADVPPVTSDLEAIREELQQRREQPPDD
jgi:hypothetical protein